MANIKTIKIADKEVEMRGSALTSVIYKELFGSDVLVEVEHMRTIEDKIELYSQSVVIYRQLGFVMAWQASNKEKTAEKMKSLTEYEYFAWLDELDDTGFSDPNYIKEVQTLWRDITKVTAIAKNAANPQ